LTYSFILVPYGVGCVNVSDVFTVVEGREAVKLLSSSGSHWNANTEQCAGAVVTV